MSVKFPLCTEKTEERRERSDLGGRGGHQRRCPKESVLEPKSKGRNRERRLPHAKGTGDCGGWGRAKQVAEE